MTLIKKQEDGESSSELALVVSGSDTVTSEQMNNNKNTNYYEYDEIEEEILRNSINEGRTTTIPVPPHLMPVFVPFVSVALFILTFNLFIKIPSDDLSGFVHISQWYNV